MNFGITEIRGRFWFLEVTEAWPWRILNLASIDLMMLFIDLLLLFYLNQGLKTAMGMTV